MAAWLAALPWHLQLGRLHTACPIAHCLSCFFLLQAQNVVVGSAPATISGLQTVMSADLANKPPPMGHPAAPVGLARFNSLQIGRTFPGSRKAVRRVVSQSAAEHRDSDLAAAEVRSQCSHGQEPQCREGSQSGFL